MLHLDQKGPVRRWLRPGGEGGAMQSKVDRFGSSLWVVRGIKDSNVFFKMCFP